MGLVGVGAFWLAGTALPGSGLLPGEVEWLALLLLAVACGVFAWYGNYDTWADRVLHLAALLLLCAAYVALWDPVMALVEAGWQRTTWLLLGVALPLGMNLAGPVRGVLVEADDD